MRTLRLLTVAACIPVIGGLLTLIALPVARLHELAAQLTGSPTALALVKKLLTPERQDEIRVLAGISVVIWIVLAMWLWFNPIWKLRRQSISGRITQLLQKTSKTERLLWVVLWVIIIATTLVAEYLLPITYDEAYSYLNFSKQGPHISLLYYAGTNNHPLFNTINSLFVGTGLSMRVFPILVGWSSLFLAAYWIRIRNDYPETIMWLLFLAVIYPILLFNIQARGYCILIFTTVLCVLLYQRVINEGWNSRVHAVLTFVFSASIWALPSSVLLVGGFYLFWLILVIRKKATVKDFLLSSCLIALLILAYVLPLIALNGTDAVLNTGTVQDMREAFSVGKALGVYLDLMAFAPGGILGIIAVACYLSIRWMEPKQKELFLILTISLILAPLIFSLLFQTLVFARSLVYLLPAIILIAAIGRKYKGSKGKYVMMWFVMILLPTLFLHGFEKQSRLDYKEAYAVEEILADKKLRTASIFSSDAFYHNLRLEREMPPQLSWEHVKHTDADYILAHRNDSLNWIPKQYEATGRLYEDVMIVYKKRQPSN